MNLFQLFSPLKFQFSKSVKNYEAFTMFLFTFPKSMLSWTWHLGFQPFLTRESSLSAYLILWVLFLIKRAARLMADLYTIHAVRSKNFILSLDFYGFLAFLLVMKLWKTFSASVLCAFASVVSGKLSTMSLLFIVLWLLPISPLELYITIHYGRVEFYALREKNLF